MLQGRALIVLGDWLQGDRRERAFEVRTMRPGDLALVKGGQLHALINSLDENVQLFMFRDADDPRQLRVGLRLPGLGSESGPAPRPPVLAT